MGANLLTPASAYNPHGPSYMIEEDVCGSF